MLMKKKASGSGRVFSLPGIVPFLITIIAPVLIYAASFPAQAQDRLQVDGIRILIYPFTVYADNSEETMPATDLSAALNRELSALGMAVIGDIPAGEDVSTPDLKKNLAIKNGAAAALWGSLTVLGNGFSIDAVLLGTGPDDGIKHFYSQGDLPLDADRAVKTLAGEIAVALSTRAIVSDVQVQGNVRIEAEAIKRVIQTKAGDVFSPEQLSADLKSIYRMGYFEDVRVTERDTDTGKMVTFHVKERPTVRKILFKNNMLFDSEELMKEITITRGSIVNISDIQRNIKQLEQLYKNKNYYNVNITYALLPEDNNQADIEFTIEQGDKFRIQKITFEGNRVYSDKQLKKIIKTSEKGFLMWIISSAGDLKMDVLSQDVARLTAHYHDNGYINARIGDPEIVYGRSPADGGDERQAKGIFITFRIEEGKHYKVGKVSLSGDLIEDEQSLRDRLRVTENTVFNRSELRMDLMRLNDLYADQGYYYVDIYPKTAVNDETLTVDIDYVISKGEPVYFDEIIITGNAKTRDKVIRRQLDFYEQELYSGKKLKYGISRLYRLNYFENVGVDVIEKKAENKIDLKIEVAEKPTGEFSFGGGYGSQEKFFASASISQFNLMGRGQVLQLQGQIGGTTTQFKLSFTEPWLFDIPLSAGVDLYDWEVDYDNYTMNTQGGGLRFGYPVFNNTRLYLSNTYEVNRIKDVYADAPSSIKDLLDLNQDHIITSSVSASLVYDSRNNVMNPTRGAKHTLTLENAGGLIGGDVSFTKYTGEVGWYVPLFWKTVGFIHSKGGYVHENANGYLPDYERFYLGGINSLRGFDWRDISIVETDADGRIIDERGGDKFVQGNLEFLFPMFGEELGLVGLLFYDTGNVYDKGNSIDLGDLRKSVGFGIRWYSPMGPIRLERGYILHPREGEDSSGRWEFSMGTAF